jgi:hypothetical protein
MINGCLTSGLFLVERRNLDFSLFTLHFSLKFPTFALKNRKNMYDVKLVREDFPILSREIYGKPLVYLDNGATTQKPRQVVEEMAKE